MRSNREDIVTDRFLRILEWPSAVGLGGLIAFLFSLKRVNPEVQFEWNTWSLVVLVIGTFLSFLLIHHVMRPARSQARLGRLAWFGITLVVITGLSFLYALKDIPTSKRFDVTVGTGAAFFFVACALYGFWRLVRFLERHGEPAEREFRDQNGQDDNHHD